MTEERIVSGYLYSLAGVAALTVVSPLIVVSAPLLVLVGPLALAWRRGRDLRPRLRGFLRVNLLLASGVLVLGPVLVGVIYAVDGESGVPPAALLCGLAFLPFLIAAVQVIRYDRAPA